MHTIVDIDNAWIDKTHRSSVFPPVAASEPLPVAPLPFILFFSCLLCSSNLFVRYAKTLGVDPPSDLQIRDAGDGSVRWSASSGVAVRLRWSGCGKVGFYGDLFGSLSVWCGGVGSVSSALASRCRRSLSTPLSSDFDGILPSGRASVSLPPAVSFEVSDVACKVVGLVARGVVCALAVANVAPLATILSEEPPSCSKRWSAWTLVVLRESPKSSSLSVLLRPDKAATVQPVLLGVECSRHGVQSGWFRYELSGLFTQLCA
ncbi:hypothetical protein IGI04_013609 [Brassica rapa subsp. trilocularis]|uniref:Uncharacterized protein n=1 Tax=Brassica rapa subsp. trilocularis TaxID=1813537 RepID=A0ABQ7N9A9_BRACM|nr:hypothetical protein IGI04_013609 [Brassica rapa subsp. trilocularis]